mmetsp:Transcript_5283/g.18772  ORF Transcript_5283/g.18772 Transcript_5283/m.18772 type:complete len:1168 (+) Transcript_5283:321-3824(+)
MLAALKDGTRGKSTTGERRKLSGKSLGRASASAHWVEKRTVDGVAYYHNQSLDKVTYEKPGDLQTDAERARGAGGPLVWIRDEAEAWVAAAPVGPAAGLAKAAKVTVSYKGRTVEVVRSATEPLWLLNEPSSLERLEQDLVLLDEVNEATMVHTLRARYMRDELYTWVGASHTVLVAINPFKRLPLYGVARMHEFARPAPNAVLPPHPFAVANTALRALATGDGNQAILISGESGAGKTEATKQCLAFLAEVSGSATHVEHKLLSANPVLEAFGNAKTVRNDNSSRFGRWMEVHFDSRNAIHSAKIENYLLEKNRVTAVAHAERSYHIFYCLCASGQFKKQGVAEAAKHAYLAKSKCVKATGVDDAGDAAAVAFALDQLGFDAEAETQGAFSLAAGVLRLGDVAFVAGPDGEAVNAATEPLADAAALLGVDDASKLGEALLNKAIDVRGLRTLSPQSPEQARAAADALAKSVYGKIFDWLVRRINAAVSGDANAAEYGAKERFIGILDIFGFEIFEKNSFEQTCINYANEKLQQHFNAHTFRDEEALYRHEGIAFQSVPFIDNGPVLDLLEKKPDGLLLALDDEVVAPQGSNAKWLARCDRVHAAKKTLWKCDARGGKDGEGTFTVSHYAGDVEYSAAGFCDKNSDPLGRALYDVMALQAPVLPLTKALFPPLGENPRRTPTIAGQFRRQLAALMVVVNATRPLYVRCVKPNAAKKPRKFAALPCVEQLTYAGVFEAVEIRKAGYPFRLTHARFAARYRPLVAASAVGNGPPKARAAAILKALTQQNFTGVKVGASMVLYRAAEHRVLELRRNLALEDIVPVAQRGARRGMGRGYRRVLAATRAALAQVERSNDAAVLDAAVSDALEALGPRQAVYAFWPPEFARCAARRAALQERLDLDVIFEALLADDGPSYDALADAVRRADRVEEGTAAQADLESRVRVRLAAAAAARLVDAADRHDGVIDGNIELDGFGQAVIDVVARHNVSREVLGILIGEDEEEPLLTKPYRRASASSLAAGALAPEEYRSPDRAPKPVAAAAEAPQLVIAAIPAFRPQADRSHDDWASHLLFETIQSRCGGLMNTKLVVTVLVGASLDTLALACLLLGGAATFGPLVCGLVLACVAVTCMSNVPSLRPLRFIFNYVLRDDRMLFAASAATLAAGLLGDQ